MRMKTHYWETRYFWLFWGWQPERNAHGFEIVFLPKPDKARNEGTMIICYGMFTFSLNYCSYCGHFKMPYINYWKDSRNEVANEQST